MFIYLSVHLHSCFFYIQYHLGIREVTLLPPIGTKLTFTKKKKKKTTHRPYLQTQGWVTANKQIFKSSLKQNILDI